MRAASGDLQQARQTRTHLARILFAAGAERIDAPAPSGVMEVSGQFKAEGYSARLVNTHAREVKAFCRWLRSDTRAADHRLGAVTGLNEAGDRWLVRWPLNDTALRRFLELTHQNPTWRGVATDDRAWLYTLAAQTGLSRYEPESLTSESFSRGGPVPTVVA
jgi:hypothetical protein